MVNYSAISDKNLLEFLLESDHRAYNEIYKRYFHLIFRHAIKKVRDEHAAKDVVQDVFTRLWLKRASIDVECNLAGYLYISARNKIFDLFAHEQIKINYWNSVEADNRISDYACVSSDYRVRELQLIAYIDRQVQELPPKMRRIFEMSRNEYLSHRQIAEELGTSEGNVSKQISNALKILRAKVSGTSYLFFLIVACMVIFLNRRM